MAYTPNKTGCVPSTLLRRLLCTRGASWMAVLLEPIRLECLALLNFGVSDFPRIHGCYEGPLLPISLFIFVLYIYFSLCVLSSYHLTHVRV